MTITQFNLQIQNVVANSTSDWFKSNSFIAITVDPEGLKAELFDPIATHDGQIMIGLKLHIDMLLEVAAQPQEKLRDEQTIQNNWIHFNY